MKVLFYFLIYTFVGFIALALLQIPFKNIIYPVTEVNILNVKIFQIISVILLLIIPVLIFYRYPPKVLKKEENDTFFTYNKAKSDFVLSGIFILFFISIQPVITLINYWNQNMVLPENIENIFAFKAQEDANTALQFLFAKSNTITDLMFNLLIMAVLPALGEELFFRAGIQNILQQKINPHTAIWITGLIFSIIHFQFYGLFTRWFLGVGLGYVFYYGQNISYSILLHFLNNTFAVISLYLFDKNMINIDPKSNEPLPILIVILGCIITIPILYYLENNYPKNKTIYVKSVY